MTQTPVATESADGQALVAHPIAPSGTLDRGLWSSAMRNKAAGASTRIVTYGRRQGVTRLLWVVAVALILRTPLSVVLAAVLPIVILLSKGLRWPSRTSSAMWTFVLMGLISSGLAWANATGMPLINNFSLMAVMALIMAATTVTRHTVATVRWLSAGLLAGLWLCLLSGVFEVVTGVKILPLIYPGANTAEAIEGNRFVVAGFFPNYNDFSVAMALLGTMLTAQLLLGAGVHPLARLARFFGLAGATFFIVVIGSRGSLVGLVLGCLLVWITAARLRHRRLVSVPALVVSVCVALGVIVFFMSTPFVQNNSTALRGQIIDKTLQMTPISSGQFWYGYGSMGTFRAMAEDRWGAILMDPHNLLLEFFTMYGVVTLIAYGACWLVITYRGLWRLKITGGWREVSLVVISVLMPVVGVVPSSSLRYYWVYLFMAGAFAVFQTENMRRRQLALAEG